MLRSSQFALAKAAAAILATTGAIGCERSNVADFSSRSPASIATERAQARFTKLDAWPSVEPLPNVPEWAVDAVFYQIFPERFRNGDPANDPTRESLEFPEKVPDDWSITPWTGDWYARAAWEQSLGDDFYEHGVFDRRYGGDLQGVLDKLDYLADLGVNVLYFNPVFYGRSLHKYDGASMHHIDPYFGPDPKGDLKLMSQESSDPKSWHWTAADKLFLKLLKKARARDIRVVIDGVFNHTGRDFFAFADLRANQQDSPYADWYIVQHFDDPDTPHNEFRYKGWWNVETLPEFSDNAEGDDLHPGPKKYVMDITRRWMDPDGDGDPSDGIDGWRLDVANEVPIKFWHDWNAHVRRLNPDAYTVAEVWDDAREFLMGGGFSATMNYHAFAFPVKGFLIDGRLSARDFGRELQFRVQEYPPAMQFVLQNLVDSHDTDRLASMIVNRPQDEPYLQADRFDYDVQPCVSPRHDETYDVRRPNDDERRIQRMVALMQMTYLGAPMVYYGDEAGMWGADDPCDRWPMAWEDLQFDAQAADPLARQRTPDTMEFDAELYEFYRDAIALRRAHPVLRRGSFSVAAADDDAKFFAFRRTLGDDQALVLFNRGEKPHTWTAPVEQDATWEAALLSDDTKGFAVDPSDSGVIVDLPPLTAAVLISQTADQ
jgi:cyclomaltodextrinase / maltogenic alpha-amylase / neopullulanase